MKKKYRKEDVDLDVALFCGPLVDRNTNQPKMCDVCGTERATWAHNVKHRPDKAYVCFGCGEH